MPSVSGVVQTVTTGNPIAAIKRGTSAPSVVFKTAERIPMIEEYKWILLGAR